MVLREIGVNIAANLLFWLGLAGSVGLLYLVTKQRRFETFFGLRTDRRLVIYLSNLWDPAMAVQPWGEIISGKELHAASELQERLTSSVSRFPDLVRGLADEFFLKDKYKITIEVSPREACLPPHNMIVIGSSIKNSVRRCLLEDRRLLVHISGESSTPPVNIHHNPLRRQFVVSREGGEEVHAVAQGLNPAVIERVVISDGFAGDADRVTFMCAGLTGIESQAATVYLGQQWRQLERAFRDKKHCARCLSLDRSGNAVHSFDVFAA